MLPALFPLSVLNSVFQTASAKTWPRAPGLLLLLFQLGVHSLSDNPGFPNWEVVFHTKPCSFRSSQAWRAPGYQPKEMLVCMWTEEGGIALDVCPHSLEHSSDWVKTWVKKTCYKVSVVFLALLTLSALRSFCPFSGVDPCMWSSSWNAMLYWQGTTLRWHQFLSNLVCMHSPTRALTLCSPLGFFLW